MEQNDRSRRRSDTMKDAAKVHTQVEKRLFLIEGKRRNGFWYLLRVVSEEEARRWLAEPHKKADSNYRVRECLPGQDVTARLRPLCVINTVKP